MVCDNVHAPDLSVGLGYFLIPHQRYWQVWNWSYSESYLHVYTISNPNCNPNRNHYQANAVWAAC